MGEEREALQRKRNSQEQQSSAIGECTEDGGWQSEVSQKNGQGAVYFTSEIAFIYHRHSFASDQNTYVLDAEIDFFSVFCQTWVLVHIYQTLLLKIFGILYNSGNCFHTSKLSF